MYLLFIFERRVFQEYIPITRLEVYIADPRIGLAYKAYFNLQLDSTDILRCTILIVINEKSILYIL